MLRLPAGMHIGIPLLEHCFCGHGKTPVQVFRDITDSMERENCRFPYQNKPIAKQVIKNIPGCQSNHILFTATA